MLIGTNMYIVAHRHLLGESIIALLLTMTDKSAELAKLYAMGSEGTYGVERGGIYKVERGRTGLRGEVYTKLRGDVRG